MTKQHVVILLIGAAVIVVGVYFLFLIEAPPNTDQATVEKASEENESPGSEVSVTPEEADAVITRTADGYSPAEVTVNKGDVVLWQNESEEHHWPASDIHPTHRIYSEFDPLRPVAPGEDWAFLFERTGQWRFHDHLRANLTGNGNGH